MFEIAVGTGERSRPVSRVSFIAGRVVTGKAVVAGIKLEIAVSLRAADVEELLELELAEESLTSSSSGFDRSYICGRVSAIECRQ